jgi:glyoxylase-like metal-dependent hydrolase (beta-lactamase superfamily II)
MSFLSEPEPPRGKPLPVAPGIRRVVASNPSVMTYWGTNTYVIDHDGGVLILDPGPDDAAHVRAVLAAAGPRVAGILLSHTHHDHLGATAAMRAATGAPVHAWHQPADPAFLPDVSLRDGDAAFGWVALHTPGHASDHICFAGPAGVVFSADHVMGWSSSIVAPPGGNMRDYFTSLGRMLSRNDSLYCPGHGPALLDPKPFVRDLLSHRQTREAAILAALGPAPQSSHALMERLYSKVDPLLKRAAERNVAAHLQKLAEEGQAQDTGAGWISLRTPSAGG